MNKFYETMNELNYTFSEQDEKKLIYRKRTQNSELILVIDLELKMIRSALVPVSLFVNEHDFESCHNDFETLKEDAKEIEKRSAGKLKVLNNE